MKTEKAERVLNEIASNKNLVREYNDYWKSITPRTNDELLRRFVFSILSVHTPWNTNVRSFQMLEEARKNDPLLYTNPEKVRLVLEQSSAGNYTVKTKGIVDCFKAGWLAHGGWTDPGGKHETWADLRNFIMAETHGLGLAKSSFALEMIAPLHASVVCLDTHMLQLYGYENGNKKVKNQAANSKVKYKEMEDHWVQTCQNLSLKPAIARAICWDKIQLQPTSRYWTYVFENNV
jgi:hypothetical protein